jgi:hypothetical protein
MTKPKAPLAPAGDPQIDETGEPEADALLSAIEEARGDDGTGTVRVERLNDQRKWEFVDETDSAAFSVRDVHQSWGGGMYRFTVRNAKGQYVHTSRRPLAGAPKHPEAKLAAESAPQPSPVNVAQMIRDAMAEQSRMLIAALAQHRPDPAPTLASRLEEFKMLRDLMAPPTPATLDATKALELLQSGIAFGREAAGGDVDPWAILAEAVKTIAEPVKTLIARSMLAAPVNGARSAAVDRVVEPTPPGHSDAPIAKSDLAGFLQLLVNRAAQDADPDLWAAALVDIVPESELRLFVAMPDAMTELVRLEPRVAQFRGWFEEILTLLKDHYASESRPATDGDGDARPAQ